MSDWNRYYADCDYVGCNPVELGRAASAEIKRLRYALEIIAGRRQCHDNLMGNEDVAIDALDFGRDGTPCHLTELG